MQKNRHAPMAWLAGAGMSTLLLVCLFLFADMRFAANDDKSILRTFLDFQPSGAATFHLYIHAMYAYPLHWLSGAFPGVAWFSILQLLLLWLSNTVIVKSVIQCAMRASQPLWLGLLLGSSFLGLFSMFNGARVTYTVTAALLSAAAVAQTLSVDCTAGSDSQITARMSFALLLVVLAYGLRQLTALPALAFCGVAFCLHTAQSFGLGRAKKRVLRPMAWTLALVVTIMGGLAIAREIEIDARGMRGYLDWQQARISVLDYINLENGSREVYDRIGWSETEVELLDNWYTMDADISTEAFRTVRREQFNSATRTSPGAALLDLQTRSPLVVRSFIILCAFGGLCVLGLLCFNCAKRLWLMLALALTGLLCFGLFCYLAWQGRLPYRAALVPVLPAAAMVFCLLPQCLPRAERLNSPKGMALLLTGTLVAGLTLWCAVPVAQSIRRVPPQWDYNAFEDRDSQGLRHPDLLLIYNNDMVNDMRLFPDLSEGMPINVMFWGGWERGSPEYQSRLAAFGLDGERFIAADWLRPFMRHVTVSPEPYEPLLRYLRQEVDPRVQCAREQLSIGLYAYRFYLDSGKRGNCNE